MIPVYVLMTKKKKNHQATDQHIIHQGEEMEQLTG